MIARLSSSLLHEASVRRGAWRRGFGIERCGLEQDHRRSISARRRCTAARGGVRIEQKQKKKLRREQTRIKRSGWCGVDGRARVDFQPKSATSTDGFSPEVQNGDKVFEADAAVEFEQNDAPAMIYVHHHSLAAVVMQLPLTRFAIWSAFALMAYMSSDFFGLAFGTYVLSYCGNSAVNLGTRHWPQRRRLLILTFFAAITLLVTTMFVWAIPSIAHEAADVCFRIQSEDPYMLVGSKVRQLLGEQVCSQLEMFLTMVAAASTPDAQSNILLAAEAAPTSQNSELGNLLKALLEKHSAQFMVGLSSVLSTTTRFTVQVVVAFVFSFMILWDFPNIASGIKYLEKTRLKTVYLEVAPVLYRFGNLVGKSLQAQALIACVNTTLTAVGIKLLAVPFAGFLSGIVFVCSFIPVIGVVLSSIPIGFLALTEHGFLCLILSILMVLLVHALEAYVFNPQIYSKTLELHPLLALAVLVMAEHSMGVFGLMMAVPVTVFIVEQLIKIPEEGNASLSAATLIKSSKP